MRAITAMPMVTASGAIELRGELAGEIAHLQSARIEVVGTLDASGKHLTVSLYRILDVGGVRPLVGFLVDIVHRLLDPRQRETA